MNNKKKERGSTLFLQTAGKYPAHAHQLFTKLFCQQWFRKHKKTQTTGEQGDGEKSKTIKIRFDEEVLCGGEACSEWSLSYRSDHVIHCKYRNIDCRQPHHGHTCQWGQWDLDLCIFPWSKHNEKKENNEITDILVWWLEGGGDLQKLDSSQIGRREKQETGEFYVFVVVFLGLLCL